jgi:hypothetical protein
MNRKTKPRWKSTFLLVAAIFSFVCSQALASKITSTDVPLKMDLQLILPDTVLLNEPFPITFNVTVNDTVRHFNDVPDEVGIYLPPSCKVIEGDRVWEGMLSRGSKVTLKITAQFTRPGADFFGGYVSTGSIPVTWAEEPNPRHPDKHYATSNDVTSRYFTVTGPRPDSVRVDARGRKFIVKDTVDARPQGTTTCGRHLSKSRQCFENQFAQKYHRR